MIGMMLVTGCTPPPAEPLSPLGVDSRVDTSYYEVVGTTPREWARTINFSASSAGLAFPAVGATRAGPAWSFASVRNSATGCEAVHPRVALVVQFLMPRLRDDSAVVGDARAEWNRFLSALWTHERGHALRAARAAELLRAQLHRSRSPTCRTFIAEARASSDTVLAQLFASQREYDERSRHGQRQGVAFVVDRRLPSPVDTTYRDTILWAPLRR
jgi:predicted secreted Zn-dependent protease